MGVNDDESKAVKIAVPGKDPDKMEEEDLDEKKEENTDNKGSKGKEDELSEEDIALMEGLELAVERSSDQDPGIKLQALEHLRKEIRTATSSMTSVPKPLKFLRPHWPTLVANYQKKDNMYVPGTEHQKLLADILSCLAMTMVTDGSRASLNYKLEGNLLDLGPWGHEYVRSIAGEVGVEWNARITADPPQNIEELIPFVDNIVPFHIEHNAFAEAVDLLIEVSQLSKLLDLEKIDDENFQRICLYLIRCSDYMSEPEDVSEALNIAYALYRKHNAHADALRVAIILNENGYPKITEIFESLPDEEDPNNRLIKIQLAFILARCHVNFEWEEDDDINEIIGNQKLSEYYLYVAKDLEVLEPKKPEDIYKSHLGESGYSRRRDASGQQIDSAQANLAATFVNAFVNTGFGTDNLVTVDDNKWIFKHKEDGMISAAASIGSINMWTSEFDSLHKLDGASEEYVKAGALLGIGIMSSGLRDPNEATLILLGEHLEESNKKPSRITSMFGLGLAYAGSNREDLIEYLSPILADSEGVGIAEASICALSLGFIFVGTCNEDAAGLIVQRLMEASNADLDTPICKMLILGLALLFFGQGENVEAMIEAVRSIEHKVIKFAILLIESMAYACSGNVLKVQEMLHQCTEHLDDEAEGGADHQAAAVLGIAAIVLGENIGTEMALRTYDHLLHYGELPIRRAVPLALALLHVSLPDYALIDQLSRLSHDQDDKVAKNAIIGLGICSIGTNNSRVAGLLRSLAEYYAREQSHLFVVRIAQGLLHAGKGLLTAHPFTSDRTIPNLAGMAGIMTLICCCLDMENTILKQYHYLLYSIVTAFYPKMLVTVDEDLNAIPVDVRVGEAMETVGQAGKPKSITGFQTQPAPVLLGVKNRAEVADDKNWEPLTSVMENIVILQKKEPTEDDLAKEE